jgi:hypothetical protein
LCEVINQMLRQGLVTPKQTHGEIVCIPKYAEARRIEAFRPITLLNTDYNLLARIMEARLRPRVAELLQTTQYCGVAGNTILDAVSTIRDVIAYAENTATPLYVLSLNFAQAFNPIAHQYLFRTLQAHGIDEWLIERIKALYDQATTAIQLQGLSVGRIPIRSGIRQECPLSIILFALCIQPLLNSMEGCLAGLAMGNSKKKIKVVAYADDIKSLSHTQKRSTRFVRSLTYMNERRGHS